MSQHYMTHPTNETAVCGANMIGRRNSRLDSDAEATTCPECMAWQLSQELLELLHPDPWGQAEHRED